MNRLRHVCQKPEQGGRDLPSGLTLGRRRELVTPPLIKRVVETAEQVRLVRCRRFGQKLAGPGGRACADGLSDSWARNRRTEPLRRTPARPAGRKNSLLALVRGVPTMLKEDVLDLWAAAWNARQG
jgi:hypothetical protein